jgi:H+/Cl- antiporter ClcA
MSIKQISIDVVTTFVVVLVVSAIVTLLWNLLRQGSGTVDWETSFHLAIILGIALPLVRASERKPS